MSLKFFDKNNLIFEKRNIYYFLNIPVNGCVKNLHSFSVNFKKVKGINSDFLLFTKTQEKLLLFVTENLLNIYV